MFKKTFTDKKNYDAIGGDTSFCCLSSSFSLSFFFFFFLHINWKNWLLKLNWTSNSTTRLRHPTSHMFQNETNWHQPKRQQIRLGTISFFAGVFGIGQKTCTENQTICGRESAKHFSSADVITMWQRGERGRRTRLIRTDVKFPVYLAKTEMDPAHSRCFASAWKSCLWHRARDDLVCFSCLKPVKQKILDRNVCRHRPGGNLATWTYPRIRDPYPPCSHPQYQCLWRQLMNREITKSFPSSPFLFGENVLCRISQQEVWYLLGILYMG